MTHIVANHDPEVVLVSVHKMKDGSVQGIDHPIAAWAVEVTACGVKGAAAPVLATREQLPDTYFIFDRGTYLCHIDGLHTVHGRDRGIELVGRAA
jgi:hypothetical protein